MIHNDATILVQYLFAKISVSWAKFLDQTWAINNAMVPQPIPHGILPTSTPNTSTINIFNVFENIHMLWMGRWIHHHATLTPYLLAHI
jgi:hypothetical protein